MLIGLTRTRCTPMAKALLTVAFLLSACAGTPTATPTASPQPISSPTATPQPTATPTPEPTPAGVKVQFHAARRVALDALTADGYTCGTEFPLSDGNPAVICTYAGATEGEGVVVIGPADDLLAVRSHSDEGDRTADFLFKFTNTEITTWVLDQVGAISQTGILPVDVSKAFNGATVRFEAPESSGGSFTLIVTVQAPDV